MHVDRPCQSISFPYSSLFPALCLIMLTKVANAVHAVRHQVQFHVQLRHRQVDLGHRHLRKETSLQRVQIRPAAGINPINGRSRKGLQLRDRRTRGCAMGGRRPRAYWVARRTRNGLHPLYGAPPVHGIDRLAPRSVIKPAQPAPQAGQKSWHLRQLGKR
jgi:hypothetical protein